MGKRVGMDPYTRYRINTEPRQEIVTGPYNII